MKSTEQSASEHTRGWITCRWGVMKLIRKDATKFCMRYDMKVRILHNWAHMSTSEDDSLQVGRAKNRSQGLCENHIIWSNTSSKPAEIVVSKQYWLIQCGSTGHAPKMQDTRAKTKTCIRYGIVAWILLKEALLSLSACWPTYRYWEHKILPTCMMTKICMDI